MGRREWSCGGEWDNCNSIINKYIKKKNKKTQNKQTKKQNGSGVGGEKWLDNALQNIVA